FFTGLPPLMALWGANVTCETNCFSVGNTLKSVPYSLSTNWKVFTPIASNPAKSTPLIRYSAWRRSSSPRFLIACAFFGLLNFGAALLDGVVHLQGLPQREQVVRNARDGKDGGLAEGEKRRIGSDGSHGGILGRAA